MSRITRLLLIRHGATPANELRPYILQGSGINHPLSSTGRRQVERLVQALENTRINAVYCSPLQRALETAQALAKPRQLQIEAVDELIEVNVGAWEGLSWDQIRLQDPEACQRFLENPATSPYLNGESYQDVFDRAWPAVETIVSRHPGETIAVVAHNVVNRVCLAHLLGRSLKDAKQISQANTGVNVIVEEAGCFRLQTLNANLHLGEFTD